MKLSMVKLQSMRAAINWAILLVVLGYIFLLKNLGIAGALIAFALLLAIMAGSLLIARSMAQRLHAVAMELLDPDLLREEMALSSNNLLKSKRMEYSRCYYEKLRQAMEGNFAGAIEQCLKAPMITSVHTDVKNCDLLHFYCRTGQLDEAQKYVEVVEKIYRDGNPQVLTAANRVLGLYYFESGDKCRGRDCLQAALSGASSNNARQILYYDIGRLDEAEGDPQSALAHYMDANRIGPKTWLGAQAKLRMVALQS